MCTWRFAVLEPPTLSSVAVFERVKVVERYVAELANGQFVVG